MFTNCFAFVAQHFFFISRRNSLPETHCFTFFQDLIVDLVSRLAVVEDPSRCCHVQTFGARAEVIGSVLRRRRATILRDLILIDRVVPIARPNVNFLAKVLDHLLNRVIVLALRR